ncbi:MAG TPA: MgtC/SapB family protein [Hyphomicrobiaceae bacterium]|nr:MgtC/SapB family protein [Hyphomicrobiaceae bacterium]
MNELLGLARTATPEHVILIRLILAILVGGIVGLDREWKRKPAGLRTMMLISFGSAMFTLITIEIVADPRLGEAASRADPVRIVEAVTAGVAFLAAGNIIQSRGNVAGLTTGASMWVSAALGVACGAGDYILAVLGALLTVAVLTLLVRLERYVAPQADRSTENTGAVSGTDRSG